GSPLESSKPETRNGWRLLLLEKMPFVGLSLISCVVTFMVQNRAGAVRTLASFPAAARVENAFVSYGRYLGKAIWPEKLAVFYPHPGHWASGLVAAAVLMVVVFCAGAWRAAGRCPYVRTG